MKIIRNNILPFRGFSAMNLFGILFVKGNSPVSEKTMNHEMIHTAQWKELWYIGFLLWYLIEWIIKMPTGDSYRNLSFEREAYENDKNLNYLEGREPFAFMNYLKQ